MSTNPYYKQLAARFRDGESAAIVEVLELFLTQDHPNVPDDVQADLLRALLAYQDGRSESLDKSLGLDTSVSGRNRRARRELAGAVHHAVMERRKKGESASGAKDNVAYDFGFSHREIERLLTHYKQRPATPEPAWDPSWKARLFEIAAQASRPTDPDNDD